MNTIIPFQHVGGVVAPDSLSLPPGSLAGLSREQVAAVARRAAELARRAPRRIPPAWVTSGPDDEGNYSGPDGGITVGEPGTGTRRWVLVGASWSPDTGPVGWLDIHWDGGQDVTVDQLRELAAAFTATADLLDAADVEGR